MKRSERVVGDADPYDEVRRRKSGRGKPLPYRFCFGAKKDNGRFVNRPYVGLAEFARQGK